MPFQQQKQPTNNILGRFVILCWTIFIDILELNFWGQFRQTLAMPKENHQSDDINEPLDQNFWLAGFIFLHLLDKDPDIDVLHTNVTERYFNFSFSFSVYVCGGLYGRQWPCKGCGGHQTASSVLLYDALPYLFSWASLSLEFDTSVALVGSWAPRTYLSLCLSCSWACMWVWWAELMCSCSHSKLSPTKPSANSFTSETELWCT